MIKKALIGLICCLPYLGAVQAADSVTTAPTDPAVATSPPPETPRTVAPDAGLKPKAEPAIPATSPSPPVSAAAPKSNPDIKSDTNNKPDPAGVSAPMTGIPSTLQPAAKNEAPTSAVTTPTSTLKSTVKTPDAATSSSHIPVITIPGTTGDLPAITADKKKNDPALQLKTVKLEPKIQVKAITDIVKMPIDIIRPYLKTSLILDSNEQFYAAPYVLTDGSDQIEAAAGSTLYVRGLKETEEFTHQVYKAGKTFEHPVTHEVLGFEAQAIATAELEKPGDPARFKIITASEPVEFGARLFPSYASVLPTNLKIRPAHSLVEQGYILSARDGVVQVGLNSVVVLSLGQREGIEAGNYLDIYQNGKEVIDATTKDWRKHTVTLPDQRIGRVLVFQTYEKLSLGLVLEANEIINLLDKVKSP